MRLGGVLAVLIGDGRVAALVQQRLLLGSLLEVR
jgi:hypothetical protein